MAKRIFIKNATRLSKVGVGEEIGREQGFSGVGGQCSETGGDLGGVECGAEIAKSKVLTFQRKEAVTTTGADGFMTLTLPPLAGAESIQDAGLAIESDEFVTRAEGFGLVGARPHAFVESGEDEMAPSLAGNLSVDEEMDATVKVIAVRAANPFAGIGGFLEPVEKNATGERPVPCPQPGGRSELEPCTMLLPTGQIERAKGEREKFGEGGEVGQGDASTKEGGDGGGAAIGGIFLEETKEEREVVDERFAEGAFEDIGGLTGGEIEAGRHAVGLTGAEPGDDPLDGGFFLTRDPGRPAAALEETGTERAGSVIQWETKALKVFRDGQCEGVFFGENDAEASAGVVLQVGNGLQDDGAGVGSKVGGDEEGEVAIGSFAGRYRFALFVRGDQACKRAAAIVLHGRWRRGGFFLRAFFP